MTAGDLGRGNRPSAHLARAGFLDPDHAAVLLQDLGVPPQGLLVETLSEAADPDVALAALVRIVEAAGDRGGLLRALDNDAGLSARLIGVLGVSSALGEHLARHPDDWQVLADDSVLSTRPTALGLTQVLLTAVGAADEDAPARDASVQTYDALRVAYRRRCCRRRHVMLQGATRSRTSPESWPISGPRCSPRRWPSLAPRCRRTHRPVGWRSSGWASAAAGSSTT